MKRKIIYIFITLALILSAFLIAKMQKPSKYKQGNVSNAKRKQYNNLYRYRLL